MGMKKHKQKVQLPPELPPHVPKDEIEVSDEDLDFVNENQEYWLERENDHLEDLKDEAKKDNDIQRRMAKNYAMRDKIARAELKRAHEKIEALTKQEEKKSLDIPAEASLHASNI